MCFESLELVKFEKKLIHRLEIKNNITNIIINTSNEKIVNLINGYNISIAAKLPHVPEANFM
jgi:hypothetical protein